MEKKGNVQNFVIIMLTVAIVVMSVGFALIDIELTLTGNTTVKSSSWKVEFKTDSSTPNTDNTVTPTSMKIDGTTVTYDVVLDEVGDVFDYNVVVKNFGSFDAKLESITITDVSAYSDYLSFEVIHNSVPYTNTTNSVSNAPTLAADGGEETIRLKAVYNKPADASKLPSEDKTIKISVTLVYGEVSSTN